MTKTMHSDHIVNANLSSEKSIDKLDNRSRGTRTRASQIIQDKTENNNNFKEADDESNNTELREKIKERLVEYKENASVQSQPAGITHTASSLTIQVTSLDHPPNILREPGNYMGTASTLVTQPTETNNSLPTEANNIYIKRNVEDRANQEKNGRESIQTQKHLRFSVQSSQFILKETNQQRKSVRESIKSGKEQIVAPHMKLVESKKPNNTGKLLESATTINLKDQRTTISEGFKESIKPAYVNVAQKLPSIGPLAINDMDEFLKNSKIDFEHFYHEKSISNYKITDFNIKQILGIGGFGKVLLGEFKKDKTLYALKIMDKQIIVKNNFIKYASNEKRILQGLNFPFVICLKYFFTDFYYLYFVMPYIPGGNFLKHMRNCKKIIESDAKFYIGQLVLALEYLHYLELIHRDVKLENIMIDAFGYLKLVDFGQCIRCHGVDKTFTLTGTPEYMAPEIIIGKGYDCAVDWWALGIITFEMCAGFRPFKEENAKKLQLLIICNRYSIPNGFSRSLKKFIQGLLEHEPKKRIGNYSKRALLIKKHVWFKGMNWLALLNRSLQAPSLPKLTVIK